jgi:hypothetical protein
LDYAIRCPNQQPKLLKEGVTLFAAALVIHKSFRLAYDADVLGHLAPALRRQQRSVFVHPFFVVVVSRRHQQQNQS